MGQSMVSRSKSKTATITYPGLFTYREPSACTSGAPPARIAEGDWIRKDGRQIRHGHGRFADAAEEQVYEGEWAEDAMHGRGSFQYSSGAKYEGEFECNKYHGHGNYTFADGSFYTGPFEDNQMHGNGCFTDTQGVEWKGRFYNGTGPGLPGHATVLAR
eukprot:CAMPEP_0182851412 /NCGR_PEP_ID=MMETSP0006_2-20121128/30615_1 /TAXON_ID=97485 /ORGANISM="Prymnesium parvum, Strain Texoma1" /LENGTH=158 /DNA_ID=CAMNT_0024982085 /DNA_START=332 /DNA_END=808 /DNA_ORIENTATION=-